MIEIYNECVKALKDNKCTECNEFWCCNLCDYVEDFKIKLVQEFDKHTWKHRYKYGLTAEQMLFIDFIILETLYENDLLCETVKKRYELLKKIYDS